MAIPSLLHFWEEHGQENIFEQRYQLRSLLMNGLEGNPSLCKFPVDQQQSPLLAYRLSEKFRLMGYQIANDLYQDHRLIVATPQFGEETVLRLSPNIYNTEDEILSSIEILNQYFSE